MDRLDGFQLVLVGDGGTFQSTPILTSGNKGNCKFNNPIPPGKYKLAMSILKLNAEVDIPKLPARNIALDMSIGNGVTINAR